MTEKIKVYLDTSVISALFDDSNPQRQFLTRLFFEQMGAFDTYVSNLVLLEIENTPDPDLREKLRETAMSFNILRVNEESVALAEEYVRRGALPPSRRNDAQHISIAVVNRIEYLISWNFEHIVKEGTRKIVRQVSASLSYPSLEITSPPEVL